MTARQPLPGQPVKEGKRWPTLTGSGARGRNDRSWIVSGALWRTCATRTSVRKKECAVPGTTISSACSRAKEEGWFTVKKRNRKWTGWLPQDDEQEETFKKIVLQKEGSLGVGEEPGHGPGKHRVFTQGDCAHHTEGQRQLQEMLWNVERNWKARRLGIHTQVCSFTRGRHLLHPVAQKENAEQIMKELVREVERWDMEPEPASLWWTSTHAKEEQGHCDRNGVGAERQRSLVETRKIYRCKSVPWKITCQRVCDRVYSVF